MKSSDLVRRTIVKSVSYRFLGSVNTLLIVYFLTGELVIGFTVSAFEIVSKSLLFYMHERVWNRISWGKKESVSAVIWFTGLSGAGKSALANKLAQALENEGLKSDVLDGDVVREIFKDIGFTRSERLRHLHSMAFIASKIERQGTILIGSFITPYEEARNYLRQTCHNYIEVWVDTPLEECELRDVKGLYARARSGEISSFTGISDPYESPMNYDIRVSTVNLTLEQSFQNLILELGKKIPELKSLKYLNT